MRLSHSSRNGKSRSRRSCVLVDQHDKSFFSLYYTVLTTTLARIPPCVTRPTTTTTCSTTTTTNASDASEPTTISSITTTNGTTAWPPPPPPSVDATEEDSPAEKKVCKLSFKFAIYYLNRHHLDRHPPTSRYECGGSITTRSHLLARKHERPHCRPPPATTSR